jgi:cytosine deaminase
METETPAEVDQAMMDVALAEARANLAVGGVPVGAALAAGVPDRVRAGTGQSADPIAHGEMSCLRNAGGQPSYLGMTLYTHALPCQMCTGAFCCSDTEGGRRRATTFAGDLEFLRRHGVTVMLVDDGRCQAVMREFQERYPEVWSEDIGGR